MSNANATIFKGRVWIVGDNINTDLILPNKAFYLTHEEQAMYVFSANRPGWAEQVKKGDILIGGRNFGMGSSRAAARSLKNLGLDLTGFADLSQSEPLHVAAALDLRFEFGLDFGVLDQQVFVALPFDNQGSVDLLQNVIAEDVDFDVDFV